MILILLAYIRNKLFANVMKFEKNLKIIINYLEIIFI